MTLIIRIWFWGPFYFNSKKEPQISKYLSPYTNYLEQSCLTKLLNTAIVSETSALLQTNSSGERARGRGGPQGGRGGNLQGPCNMQKWKT